MGVCLLKKITACKYLAFTQLKKTTGYDQSPNYTFSDSYKYALVLAMCGDWQVANTSITITGCENVITFADNKQGTGSGDYASMTSKLLVNPKPGDKISAWVQNSGFFVIVGIN